MSQLWRFAVQNLARNKRRNMATGFAIALGFAALLTLGGYATHAQRNLKIDAIYENRTGHIVIYKEGGLEGFYTKPKDFSLTSAEQTKIEQVLSSLGNVEVYSPIFYGTGLIGNGCKTLPFIATGIDPAIDKWIRSRPETIIRAEQKRSLQKGLGLAEYPREFGAIAISRGLAKLLGKTKVVSEFPAGKAPLVMVDCMQPDASELIAQDANVQLMSVSWEGMTSAIDGEVVSHFTSGVSAMENLAITIPIWDLQKLFGTENIAYFSVWLKDERQLSATLKELARKLAKVEVNAEAYRWDDEKVSPMYVGITDFLFTLISFIAAILVTIIIFSILNATTITAIERSHEIGMLRSVGFTRRQIQVLFVREMTALTALSILFGGLISAVSMLCVSFADITFQPPGMVGGIKLQIVPDFWTCLLAVISVFTVAAIANFIAVRKLSHIKIATLLSSNSH